MYRHYLMTLLGTLLLAVSAAASAQNAYTARPVNVRAGPDRSYPLVAQLGPGAPVQVEGCLDDWSWCDIAFEDNRGWAYAPNLAYVYQGERVPLYTYAPGLAIPVITFSLGTYWDQYYRNRPFFAQRQVWINRHIQHMRPPGPPPHAGPPPVHGNARVVREHNPHQARPAAGAHPQARPEGRAAGEEHAPAERTERAPAERAVTEHNPHEARPENRAAPQAEHPAQREGERAPEEQKRDEDKPR